MLYETTPNTTETQTKHIYHTVQYEIQLQAYIKHTTLPAHIQFDTLFYYDLCFTCVDSQSAYIQGRHFLGKPKPCRYESPKKIVKC